MTFKKRTSTAIFVIIDIMIAIVSAIMPFVLRFGVFYVGAQVYYLDLTFKWLPLDAAIFIGVNALMRLYNRVWAFASVSEMYDCIKSAVITEAIYVVYKMILGIYMFRSYYPCNFMIMLMLLGVSRLMVRFLLSGSWK